MRKKSGLYIYFVVVGIFCFFISCAANKHYTVANNQFRNGNLDGALFNIQCALNQNANNPKYMLLYSEIAFAKSKQISFQKMDANTPLDDVNKYSENLNEKLLLLNIALAKAENASNVSKIKKASVEIELLQKKSNSLIDEINSEISSTQNQIELSKNFLSKGSESIFQRAINDLKERNYQKAIINLTYSFKFANKDPSPFLSSINKIEQFDYAISKGNFIEALLIYNDLIKSDPSQLFEKLLKVDYFSKQIDNLKNMIPIIKEKILASMKLNESNNEIENLFVEKSLIERLEFSDLKINLNHVENKIYEKSIPFFLPLILTIIK